MNKLLVVVDYQHDFVEGSLGFPKAKELEQGIYNKVNKYIENGDKILFTCDTHSDDYLNTREGKMLSIKHCIKGTEGNKLYGILKVFEEKQDENIIFVEKESFGISPNMMIKLQKTLGEPDSIEIIGIVTNMCVISNVVTFQSQYINSDITVDASLCAGFDEELHEKALDVIESIHINVLNR